MGPSFLGFKPSSGREITDFVMLLFLYRDMYENAGLGGLLCGITCLGNFFRGTYFRASGSYKTEGQTKVDIRGTSVPLTTKLPPAKFH